MSRTIVGDDARWASSCKTNGSNWILAKEKTKNKRKQEEKERKELGSQYYLTITSFDKHIIKCKHPLQLVADARST